MAVAPKQDPELNSPVVHSALRGPDKGLEYMASTNAVQNVLDKLKRSGGFKNKPTDQGADKESLSSLLDGLIEFRESDQAPEVKSWNPITRHRQAKAFKEWVQARPPSAGITAEQLEKKYPAPGRARHVAGAATGGILGAGLGVGGAVLAARKGKIPHELTGHVIQGAAAIGAGVGGAGGWFASDPKHFIEQHRQHKKDWSHLKETFQKHGVEPRTIKGITTPIATSHREVAGELKKQNVGFIKRHGIGLATFPIRHSVNAAFIPQGEKGLIVSGKKVPPEFIKHESGHAKDYAYYGGSRGFHQQYPKYGQPSFAKKTYISNTMLPEYRAWGHAGRLSEREKKTKEAALRTYARGGFLLSSLLDNLIQFQYPEEVIKSVWRGIKKPSRKTLGGIMRSASGGGALPNPKMVFRDKEVMRRYVRRVNPHIEDIASAFDRFKFSQKLDQLIQFQGDPRPRNNLGEFSGNQDQGPDPNAMVKTYRVAPATPGVAPDKGILSSENKKVAGLAALAGAAGTLGGESVKQSGKAVAHLAKKLSSRFRK